MKKVDYVDGYRGTEKFQSEEHARQHYRVNMKDIDPESLFEDNFIEKCKKENYIVITVPNPFGAKKQEMPAQQENTRQNMKVEIAKISDIISGKIKSPLPIEIIPNNMGINLCSVDSVCWQKTENGELTSLTIFFIPGKES